MEVPTIIYHKAEILEWHDGDTCKVAIERNVKIDLPDMDLGFRDYVKDGQLYSNKHIRIWGLNCPELHVGGKVNPTGIAAKNFSESFCPVGMKVRLGTLKNPEKFGRWLGVIFFEIDGKEKCLNQLILESGNAIPYLQGKLKFW